MKNFARCLVDLFYPLVEASVLDAEGAVQEIFNAFSTRKEDQVGDVKNMDKPFQEQLAIGREVRTLVYSRPEGGYLRLRYDLTHFKNLQTELNLLVQGEIATPLQGWKEAIERVIAGYLAEHKIKAPTSKQKRELITLLRNQGLLDFKESSAYVAAKLGISRATLYNYLKTGAHFKKVHIHQVDTFTSEKFAGNPAGVVLDADVLEESDMRKITRELNLSETAFVLESAKGDFRLRYFTPTGHEIVFCGHSTVGALYMIAKEERFGIKGKGIYAFKVETPCGMLKMEVSIDAEIRVAYETPVIKLKKAGISHDEVAKAAGFDVHIIDKSLPVMREETNKDLFVVIPRLEDLKQIDCDSKSLAQFSKAYDLVALCLLSKETFDPKNQFHMRCFAPLVGINEDAFTGSVLGGLTAYADTFGLMSGSPFRVEQGHIINRPGVVEVEFSKKPYKAKVLAKAVHCFSTEISL